MVNISELKDSMVTEDQLFHNGIVISLSDVICKNTNCYDYALGIMNADDNVVHLPGFTGKETYTCRGNLEKKISEDLKNLGKRFRRLSILGPINLQNNERLIKVFFCSAIGDFHVLRQNPKSGKWYHKPGSNQPLPIALIGSSVDDEPDELIFTDAHNGKRFSYYSVCYFAIVD